MNNATSYIFVLLTLILGVYGQLILKARILNAGIIPPDFHEKIVFIIKLLMDPRVLRALAGAFLASLCWMAAMARLPLSYAYPFTSLSFVMILILSSVFFNEPITIGKIIGLLFIISGIVITCLS